MTTRKERLRKLVTVQEQLKALHETRHAAHLATAAAAGQEAAEIAARFDADDSMSVLFPEIYNRRIGQALARQEENIAMAREEAGRIATATARTNMVERAYRDVRRQDERDHADRERLEIIERKQQGE
jgi:hypothetical protein